MAESGGNGSKVTQRDVFVGIVSIVVAAIGAGTFANSCSGGSGDAAGGDSSETSTSGPANDDNGGESHLPWDLGDGQDDADDADGSDDGQNGAEDSRHAGEELYLSDLRPVSGGHEVGTVNINGAEYPNSVQAEFFCDDYHVGYDLAGQWNTLEVTLGVSSEAPSYASYRFAIVVDNEQIGPWYELDKFTTEELSVDVSDAVEVRFHARSGDGCGGGYPSWGSARLTS